LENAGVFCAQNAPPHRMILKPKKPDHNLSAIAGIEPLSVGG
jgi:hypothetical protein